MLIKAFKEWSDQNEGLIEILASTGKTTAMNKFKSGASEDEIKELSEYFSAPLPPDYISFYNYVMERPCLKTLNMAGEPLIFSPRCYTLQ